jgi:hypothetical protein
MHKENIVSNDKTDPIDVLRRDLGDLVSSADLEAAMLAYLIATSRRASRPLWCTLTGALGSAKSHIVDLVRRMIPPEDVILATDGTEKWLETLPAPEGVVDLGGRVVVTDERTTASLDGRLLRSLYESQAAVRRGPHGRSVEFRGCPAWLETTTLERFAEEDRSRRIVINVVEDERKFLEVRESIGRQYAGEVPVSHRAEVESRHRQAQAGLPRGATVEIPFAVSLVRGFPSGGRLVRACHHLLSLIETVTLLRHQDRGAPGRPGVLRATIEDYAIVHALYSPLLQSIVRDLSSGAVDLAQAIARGVNACPVHDLRRSSLSYADMQAWTGWSRQTLERRTRELIDRGVLLSVKVGGKGRAHGFRLAADWERRVKTPVVLPRPEDLMPQAVPPAA